MLAETYGCLRVFLFEDACLLAEGVNCKAVAQEVYGCLAGVFGYGHYSELNGGEIRWSGTPEWCERQQIVFEKLLVSRFWHVDMVGRAGGETGGLRVSTPKSFGRLWASDVQ